jgi:hypothetical protein
MIDFIIYTLAYFWPARMEEIKCERRRRHMDKFTRPRTETYEYMSCVSQRLQLESPELPGPARSTRRDYTDYDIATSYHSGLSGHGLYK